MLIPMSAQDPYKVVEFIPKDELPPSDLDRVLTEQVQSTSPHMVIPRGSGLTRKQVAQGFQEAFELIGGVPRLAAWAHENAGDFYKLYAKLFPAASSPDLDEAPNFRIIHVLPRTALDMEDGEVVRVDEEVDG